MSHMSRKTYDLDDDLVQRVRDYRFDVRLDSDADAVRRLLDIGLKAEYARLEAEKKK